jgi:hypothetical protein
MALFSLIDKLRQSPDVSIAWVKIPKIVSSLGVRDLPDRGKGAPLMDGPPLMRRYQVN